MSDTVATRAERAKRQLGLGPSQRRDIVGPSQLRRRAEQIEPA